MALTQAQRKDIQCLLQNFSNLLTSEECSYFEGMLWGTVDGKDVHLVTLKTEKLEALLVRPMFVRCV